MSLEFHQDDGTPSRGTLRLKMTPNALISIPEIDPDRILGDEPRLGVLAPLRRPDLRDEVRGAQAAALPGPVLHPRGGGQRGRGLQAGERLRPHLSQPLPTDRAGAHIHRGDGTAQGEAGDCERYEYGIHNLILDVVALY